ncbi:hypothetical protein [Streptomyces sp. NPDC059786]|uniref:hypothetical protein n=1 Tax=Streptomyces sp. NPDC059786 TaxID=3346946 RepID=UPI00364AE070
MRVGITGHRDLAGEVAEHVRHLLVTAVTECDPAVLVGVSCLAAGPDCWFAEAVLAHGGRLEAVIPALRYRDFLPAAHRPVYDRLLGRASALHGPDPDLAVCDGQAYMAAGRTLVALVDELWAVWDGKEARGPGGTGDVVAQALGQGLVPRVLWPTGASR